MEIWLERGVQSEEEIMVIVAGGTARRLCAVVPGRLAGRIGARPVTRAVEG
jgi:hypothetical protein